MNTQPLVTFATNYQPCQKNRLATGMVYSTAVGEFSSSSQGGRAAHCWNNDAFSISLWRVLRVVSAQLSRQQLLVCCWWERSVVLWCHVWLQWRWVNSCIAGLLVKAISVSGESPIKTPPCDGDYCCDVCCCSLNIASATTTPPRNPCNRLIRQ